MKYLLIIMSILCTSLHSMQKYQVTTIEECRKLANEARPLAQSLKESDDYSAITDLVARLRILHTFITQALAKGTLQGVKHTKRVAIIGKHLEYYTQLLSELEFVMVDEATTASER